MLITTTCVQHYAENSSQCSNSRGKVKAWSFKGRNKTIIITDGMDVHTENAKESMGK